MAAVAACCGCGAIFPVLEGPTHPYMLSSPACWAAYGEVLVREYSDPALFAAVHRLTVDAYALQHPGDPHDRRAVQSVSIHFAALDAIFNTGASHGDARAILLKLAGQDFSPLPPMPQMLVTVRDVAEAPLNEHAAKVEQWARTAHATWAPLLQSTLRHR